MYVGSQQRREELDDISKKARAMCRRQRDDTLDGSVDPTLPSLPDVSQEQREEWLWDVKNHEIVIETKGKKAKSCF